MSQILTLELGHIPGGRSDFADDGLPVVTFNDAIGFHVNGMELRGIHVENAHTDGDAMVFFDGANIVHMGDVWFNGLHPFADWSSGGNLDGIIAACDKVLEKIDAETKIIPGHGALGNKAELAEYRDLMQTISERIDALLDEGNSVEEVVAAKPITEWDEALVNTWLTPDQFVEIVARGFVNAAEHDYEISPCSSLHAATRIEATDRRRLERLCRYVIRPPVASGRLRFVDAETLVFSLKTHWPMVRASWCFHRRNCLKSWPSWCRPHGSTWCATTAY